MAHREYELREIHIFIMMMTLIITSVKSSSGGGEEKENSSLSLLFSLEDFFSSVCMIYNVFLNVFYLVMYPKISLSFNRFSPTSSQRSS